MIAANARLYYATEHTNGEFVKLREIIFSGPRYGTAQSFSGAVLCHYVAGPGDVTFEVDYDENFAPIRQMFDCATAVEWTLETPTATWGFKGYVAAIEMSCGMFGRIKVKLAICGPVTCYSYAAPVATDNSPVMTKSASKAQAENLARVLGSVLARQPETAEVVYVPNTADAPEPPQPEEDVDFVDWED